MIQRVTMTGDRPLAAAELRFEPYTRRENAGAASRYDAQLNTALGREATTPGTNRRK